MASGIEGAIGQLFCLGTMLFAGFVISQARKRQREREAAETQEQLRRVDEAVRLARQRAGRAGSAPVASGALPAAAAPFAYAVTPPAADLPFALPVEDHEGPREAGAWEREHAGPRRPLPRPVLAAAAGFAPPTAEEMRQAVVWREVFAPCPGLGR